MNGRILFNVPLSMIVIELGVVLLLLLTWQGTEKGLLFGMASHVSFQGISTRMDGALSSAVTPFACVLGTFGTDVVVLYVLNQVIAVSQIPNRTAIPLACCDLIGAQCIFVMRW